jgi:hypothetical protein
MTYVNPRSDVAQPAADAAQGFVGIGGIAITLTQRVLSPSFHAASKLTGATEIFQGIFRITHLASILLLKGGVGRSVIALEIAREVTRVISGFTTTLSNILTIVIDVLKKIGGVVVESAKYIKTTVSGVSCFLYALTAVPKVIQAVNCFTIIGGLENKSTTLVELYNNKPNELKLAAPGVFARLEKSEMITECLVKSAVEECKGNGVLSIVTVALSVIAIVATILVTVFTAGSGLIVGAVIGTVVSLVVTAVDIKTWVTALKEAKGLTNTDLVVSILSIALGVISLVLTVVFAPTLILAIVGGLLCSLMIAIPLINIVYLKVKETSNSVMISK